MKSLLTLSCVLLAICCFGQQEELENLKVDGNNITWQKVFPSVLSTD